MNTGLTCMPDTVEPDNEINNLISLPAGIVEEPDGAARLTALLTAGILGFREGSPSDTHPRIMIDIAHRAAQDL